jgi:hypothetical protein
MTALALWDERRTDIRASESRQVHLGVVLAEQAGRALQAVDLVLEETVQQLQAGALQTAGLASETLRDQFGEKLRNLPQVEALTVQNVIAAPEWTSISANLSPPQSFYGRCRS